MSVRLNHMTRIAAMVAALALVPALAGCATERSIAPSPEPSSLGTPDIAPADGQGRIAMAAVELVRVETTGGMCASGTDGEGREGSVCTSTLVVNGDGSWKVSDKDTRTGMLSFDERVELTGLLFDSDVTARPKAETSCASWVDGQDVTVTYTPADGAREGSPVSVSSCNYDFSDSDLMAFLADIAS